MPEIPPLHLKLSKCHPRHAVARSLGARNVTVSASRRVECVIPSVTASIAETTTVNFLPTKATFTLPLKHSSSRTPSANFRRMTSTT